MTFEEYLVSKKIDQGLFKDAEPKLFQEWKNEFEQLHVNSFTAQKLYLINPIRRKYVLKVEPVRPAVTGIDNKSKSENKVAGEAIDPNRVVEAGTNNPSVQQKEISPSDEKPASALSPKPARPIFKPKPKMN